MLAAVREKAEQIRCGKILNGYKRTKCGIVPVDWRVCSIGECLIKVEKPVNVQPDKHYVQIGIRSHGKGLFYKEPVLGKSLGNKSVFWIEPDCFVLNIVFAWEQAIGKTTQAEVGMIGSHRFPMYRPVNEKIDINYLIAFLMTKRGKKILESASPGGAGRNRTLGQARFMKSVIVCPPIEEQHRIVSILSLHDKYIEQKEKLLAEKQKQKKYLCSQLLSGKKRISGFNEPWVTVELGDVFDYIQPGPYLVKSAEYSNDYNTPVLTAGKTFVLGYTNECDGIFTSLPVVIFDDFTTASKYVDFPFKTKSSAMKILTIKKGFNIKFAYESMQQIHYVVGGHERHWISKFSNLTIDVPQKSEQDAIANVLDNAEQEIRLIQQSIEEDRRRRKALMQLLITGIVRV